MEEQKSIIDSILDNVLNEINQVQQIVKDIRRTNNIITDTVIKIDDIEINLDARTIRSKDYKIKLTRTQMDLLEILLSRLGQVVSYEQISRELYDLTVDESLKKSLRVAINRLRDRIKKVFHIQIIRSKGYVLSIVKKDE